AGSVSVTWTPVAFDGPRSVAVIVKVTFEPTMTVPLLAVLSMAISAREVTVVGSFAVSFATLTSLPPETLAVLVTDTGAACRTVTVIVMAGWEAFDASASIRIQVTVCAATPQPQPVPVAVDGVKPAGSVSETVTAPLVDTGPMLLTTS